MWQDAFLLEVGQAVVERAGDLALRHALRGCDAVHLAAALSLRQPDEPEEGPAMVTWDERLARAALAEGLQTVGDRIESPPGTGDSAVGR
jgi:predicted nucleic acid-binding protein